MRLKSLLVLVAVLGLVATMAFGSAVGAANAQSCSQYYTVQWGDTLFRIARRYGTSVAELQSLNFLGSSTRIYAGQTLCVAVNSGSIYVVQYGDTLSRIARRFGVNAQVLANVNNITNPNRIYAGQTLVIPDFTIQ